MATANVMTKHWFLQLYRAELLRRYDWTNEKDGRLDRMVHDAGQSLYHYRNNWDHTGPATAACWEMMGGTGKPTLMDLRKMKD